MKKIVIIFVLSIFVGLFFIGSNVMTSKSITNSKKETSMYDFLNNLNGSIIANNNFSNTDENYNPLRNFKYKLTTWNNKFPIYSSESNTAGIYNLGELSDLDASEAFSILSDEQKEVITSIRKYGDLEDIYGEAVGNDSDSYTCYYYVSGTNDIKCELVLPTYFILEQTRVPEGYTKQKYVLLGSIYVIYTFNSDIRYPINNVLLIDREQEMTLSYINAFVHDFGFLEYGDYPNILKNKYSEDVVQFIRNNVIYDDSNWCGYDNNILGSHFQGTHITDIQGVFYLFEKMPDVGNCPMLFKNKKGSPSLSIQSYVNEKESVSTTTNSKIPYRVTVKNSGMTASYDNVIAAKLPDGFTYVEGSASNGGIYNSNTNIITWNVATIDVNSTINLTFEAFAPNGLSSLNNYVSEATVDASNISNKVTSNKTIVKLMANPKTIAPIYGIGITLIIVWGIVFYLYFDKRKKEVIKAS